MQSKRIGEQISILKNVRELILTKKLEINESLLSLLDKVGVNLQGYAKKTTREEKVVSIDKNKEKIITRDAA